MCFLAVWAGRRVFFCCLGGPGRRRVFSFAGKGWGDGVRVVFSVWTGRAEGVLLLLFGRGAVCCCLLFGRGRFFLSVVVWAGGVCFC